MSISMHILYEEIIYLQGFLVLSVALSTIGLALLEACCLDTGLLWENLVHES